jgi:hypothetical protein
MHFKLLKDFKSLSHIKAQRLEIRVEVYVALLSHLILRQNIQVSKALA